ncbi:MAG TPA: hypothetical protein VK953_06715 [Methylophilus sp.]|nr:hypothetical protein [Methylophilus sp.]
MRLLATPTLLWYDWHHTHGLQIHPATDNDSLLMIFMSPVYCQLYRQL